LKTPDVNKQKHWRRKLILSHHYADRCLFSLGSWPLSHSL